MDLLNETVLLKTKSTLFNLLIRETSHFPCYERVLNMTYVAYKNAFFLKMQFWSHCYTAVSYQALFRLSVYKFPAVYLSGAKNVCFCTIRDFGSPTIMQRTVKRTFFLVLHSNRKCTAAVKCLSSLNGRIKFYSVWAICSDKIKCIQQYKHELLMNLKKISKKVIFKNA